MGDKQASLPSRGQLLFNLAYSMVPLLGFWLVEKYYGLHAGVIAAVVLALAEVIWVYYHERRLEFFAVFSAILVIVMGLISWQLESTVILRLKPAIIEGIFAALLLGSSLSGKPFLLIIARKQLGQTELPPLQLSYLRGVNWRVGLLFLLHTLVTVYAALMLSMDAWAFVKGVLFYLLFAVYCAGEFIYSRWRIKRQHEQWQKQQAFLDYQRDIIRQVRSGKGESDAHR